MKILVSGASYATEGITNENFSWATYLRNEFPASVINLSRDGFSSDYVTRTIMHNCEIHYYDYVVAMFPSITNRREMIVKDEMEKGSKYDFLAISGSPENHIPTEAGKFLNRKKLDVLEDWEGYMMNQFDDQFNQLQNIVLLGQYLKMKGIKHHMIFDLSPYPVILQDDCSGPVNINMYTMGKLARNYISFTEYSTTFIDANNPEHWNSTLHPSRLGHEIIGKRIENILRNL